MPDDRPYSFPGGGHFVGMRARQAQAPNAAQVTMALAPVQRAMAMIQNACDPAQPEHVRPMLMQNALDVIEPLEVGYLGVTDAMGEACKALGIDMPQRSDRPPVGARGPAEGPIAGQGEHDTNDIRAAWEESRAAFQSVETLGTDEGPSGTYRGNAPGDSGISQGVKGEPTEALVMPSAEVAPRGVTPVGPTREIEPPDPPPESQAAPQPGGPPAQRAKRGKGRNPAGEDPGQEAAGREVPSAQEPEPEPQAPAPDAQGPEPQ